MTKVSVRLEKISSEDYARFREAGILDYAAEKVQAGNWPPEGSLEKARESYDSLLPQGSDTPGSYIYSVVDNCTGAKVGVIWFSVVSEDDGPPAAFIYEFNICEERRRQGYGEAAMLAVEEKVREFGLDTISLHVFGHNLPARALYEKVGYVTTNINMSKKIG